MDDKYKRKRRFLELLNAATLETGVSIGGCGCCGSPFLSNESSFPGRYKHDSDFDNVRWEAEQDDNAQP